MADSTYKYSAFISYYHGDSVEPGREWAPWTEAVLKSFLASPELRKKEIKSRYGDPLPHSLPGIFLDRSKLGASGDLPGQLQEALVQSRVLVVLCSPESARREWVCQEIVEFKKLGRHKQIVAVVLSGEPYAEKNHKDPQLECLAEPLRWFVNQDGSLDRQRPGELNWVDLRGIDNSRGATTAKAYLKFLTKEYRGEWASARMRRSAIDYEVRLREARVKLLAGVLGLEKDEVEAIELIRHEEAVRIEQGNRKRFLQFVTVIVLVLIAMSSVIGVQQWLLHKQNAQMAEMRRSLPNSPGPEVVDAATKVQDPPSALLPVEEKAALDAILANVQQGYQIQAAATHDQAIEQWDKVITEARTWSEKPGSSPVWKDHLVEGWLRKGESLGAQGKLPEASIAFEAGVKAINDMDARDRNQDEMQRKLSMLLLQFGSTRLVDVTRMLSANQAPGEWAGLLDAADSNLAQSANVMKTLAVKHPEKPFYRVEEAGINGARALLKRVRGDVQAQKGSAELANSYYLQAIEDFKTWQPVLEGIPQTDPGYSRAQQFLFGNYIEQVNAQTKAGKSADNLQTLTAALPVITRLAAKSPGDAALEAERKRIETLVTTSK